MTPVMAFPTDAEVEANVRKLVADDPHGIDWFGCDTMGVMLRLLDEARAKKLPPPRCTELWDGGFSRPLRCFGDAGHSGEHVW